MSAVPIRLFLALVVVTLCGSGVPLCADPSRPTLNPKLSVSQYDYRAWTMEDGLPSDQVLDILQTRDGYLWLATDRGLARFDGVTFATFNRSNTPDLASNRLTTLLESHDGSLWIGARGGGLVSYRHNRRPAFRRFKELEDYWIRSLFEDADGVLWIGTDRETWTLQGEKLTRHENGPVYVGAICADSNGIIWLGAAYPATGPEVLLPAGLDYEPGLFRHSGGEFKKLTKADGYPYTGNYDGVLALASDGSGGLWVGQFGRALMHYKDGVSQEFSESIGHQCYDIHVEPSGHVWFSSRDAAVQRLVGDTSRRLPGNRLMPVTTCIAADREGNLWLGGSRGFTRVSNPQIERVDLNAGNVRATCVLEDTEGRLWIGSSNRTARGQAPGLHQFRGGDFTRLGIDDGLPSANVTCLTKAPDGSVWIGTAKGMVRLHDGKITIPTTNSKASTAPVGTLHVGKSGDAWFGMTVGSLRRLNRDQVIVINGFGPATVTWFHETVDGVLWIGSTHGLFQRRGDGLQRVSDAIIERLPTHSFSTCLEDQQGQLWLGTNGGGLCRYWRGKFVNWTSEDGLYEDSIYAIAEDERGRLWLGGPHGLTSLEKNSFHRYESGIIDGLPVRVDSQQHRFAISSRPNAVRRSDGSLWFVTKTGVVTVPAEGPVRNLVEPIVHIENVRVDGEPTDLDTAVELRSGARRVEFEYTATSFTAPEKVQFRYQLGGYNDQWIEAGTQRRASYTDLPPGQYVFRVTADNGHGVWSGENETLDLTVLPRWWELTWLRITAALAALALLVGYFKHRLRVARQTNAALRREMSERQRAEEESRIQQLQLVRVSRAASMGELTTSIAHEVKQPLFAIISNAQAARRFLDRKEPDVEEVSEALEEIAEDGERASEIVEHVRSLMQRERRPSQRLDLSEVARDATRFAEPEIRRRGLVIDTQLAADLPPVEGNPIELQQVILNLLINGAQAMKTLGHSEPRHLAVRTRADNGSVELAVEDHGAGVSDEVIDKMFEPFFTTKPTGTGMGLAINRTIIEAHGGRIWATRNEGAGSTFCFCLPACRESQS